ncbi:MAG: catalase, partial [Nitrospira sp.]|nr:catalase [Nitrospira sp.]
QAVEEGYHTRGAAIRDAHPKAHGCVKALFQVDETLDASLAKGVFRSGYTYEAWLRFSNSSADPDQADITGDGRGLAIKLMGIQRSELQTTGTEALTQDFIMISHPTFIMDDPSDYVSFQEEITNTKWLNKIVVPFTLGLKGAWNAYQITRKTIENPLQTRYWSMVPYQLGTGPGRQAIKFSAKPFSDSSQSCPALHDEFPSDPHPNFLRQALRHTLTNGQACMQFFLQPRAPSMSVENSKDEWKEADAPFVKVATIHIPQQEFDTPEQNLFCENLSFDPWHALPEHRPLGVINRLRRIIYPHISESRHRLNSAPRIEPQGIPRDK